MTHQARTEDPAPYRVDAGFSDDDAIIARALEILARRVRAGPIMGRPQVVKDLCRMHFAAADAAGHEEFAVLFLDHTHRLLEIRTLFRGTLAATSVYPREVVKEALALNAGTVVLAHNHPSGSPEPSRADEYLTQTLKSALQLVDVRVLDHIVVGNPMTVSFAERGLV